MELNFIPAYTFIFTRKLKYYIWKVMTCSRRQLLKPFVAKWSPVLVALCGFAYCPLLTDRMFVGISSLRWDHFKDDKVPVAVEVDLGCEKRGCTRRGYLDLKLFKMGQCILLNMRPLNFTYYMPEWLISSFFPRTSPFLDKTWNTKDTKR